MLHTNRATKHYNAKRWIFGDKVQSLYNDFLFLKLIISKIIIFKINQTSVLEHSNAR